MIALTCHSNWVPPWNTITMNLLIKTGIHRLIALTQFIGLGPKSSRQVTWHTTISSQPALLLSCEKGHAVSASAWSSDPIWSTHSALLLTINKLGGWKTHYLSWDSGADGPCLLRGAQALWTLMYLGKVSAVTQWRLCASLLFLHSHLDGEELLPDATSMDQWMQFDITLWDRMDG